MTAATHVFAITPDDDRDLQYVTEAIRCGGAGDLAIQTVGRQTVIIQSVRAGETLHVKARKVYHTSTTATEIVGFA